MTHLRFMIWTLAAVIAGCSGRDPGSPSPDGGAASGFRDDRAGRTADDTDDPARPDPGTTEPTDPGALPDGGPPPSLPDGAAPSASSSDALESTTLLQSSGGGIGRSTSYRLNVTVGAAPSPGLGPFGTSGELRLRLGLPGAQ